MSLEQSLAELTAEVAKLITEMHAMSAELRTLTDAIAVEIHKGHAEVPAGDAPVQAVSAAGVNAVPVEFTVETTPAASTSVEPATTPAITDTDLKNAFVALVNKHGRETMTQVLADFGATKFSGLPKGKYSEIEQAIAKAMG